MKHLTWRKRIALAFSIIGYVVLCALTISPSAHAATHPHFHPTRRATHIPPGFSARSIAATSGCGLFYITSASDTLNGYYLYAELDGSYDNATGAYCGQVEAFSEVGQPAHAATGSMTSCVLFEDISTEEACTSRNVQANINYQYWGLWSNVDTTSSCCQYGAETTYLGGWIAVHTGVVFP